MAGSLRGKVLAWVEEAGPNGLTAIEAAAKLAAERGPDGRESSCRYSVAPRLSELSRAGLVVDTGIRRDDSTAWVAAAAKEVL